MEYDRDTLISVLIYHYASPTNSCSCGWNELGKSWPEHLANMYELVLTQNKDYECPHLNTEDIELGWPGMSQTVKMCLDCKKEV